MAPFDDFVHISTHPRGERRHGSGGGIGEDFLENSKGSRQFTEGLMVESIRRNHPNHLLSVNPSRLCDLLAFGRTRDDVKVSPHGNIGLKERIFMPPARRYNDENGGRFMEEVKFGCYDYVFKGTQFLLYVVDGVDGMFNYKFNYLLIKEESTSESKASPQALSDELVELATEWAQGLHNEVLVFDQGFWQKNTELWENIQKSEWEDVILEDAKKEAIIDDVIGFFDGEDRYAEFNVPWKVCNCTPPQRIAKLMLVVERRYILRPSRSALPPTPNPRVNDANRITRMAKPSLPKPLCIKYPNALHPLLRRCT
jgi:transitional endoplasmic reticulum ATPase